MTSPPSTVTQSNTVPPAPGDDATGPTEGQRKAILIGAVVVIVLLILGGLAAAFWLVQNPAQAASVRDVFIIFMALEFMLIGVALVIFTVWFLVVQGPGPSLAPAG